MSTETKATQIKAFAARLEANASDWYADVIDHPTLMVRARALWNEAEQAGVNHEVAYFIATGVLASK